MTFEVSIHSDSYRLQILIFKQEPPIVLFNLSYQPVTSYKLISKGVDGRLQHLVVNSQVIYTWKQASFLIS